MTPRRKRLQRQTISSNTDQQDVMQLETRYRQSESLGVLYEDKPLGDPVHKFNSRLSRVFQALREYFFPD